MASNRYQMLVVACAATIALVPSAAAAVEATNAYTTQSRLDAMKDCGMYDAAGNLTDLLIEQFSGESPDQALSNEQARRIFNNELEIDILNPADLAKYDDMVVSVVVLRKLLTTYRVPLSAVVTPQLQSILTRVAPMVLEA